MSLLSRILYGKYGEMGTQCMNRVRRLISGVAVTGFSGSMFTALNKFLHIVSVKRDWIVWGFAVK